MHFFDPHIHMTSRTTDDYEAMAAAGVRAIVEPAFWLGQPRTSLGAFTDYYASLIGWERFRAAQFGIQHYCAIGLNSKEANNEGLAKEVDRTPIELGIVTNLLEDHLERHGTAEAYHAAKLELLDLLSDGAPLLVGDGVVER